MSTTWPLERLTGREIRALEAGYLSEALLGETVAVRSLAGPSESRHTIVELGGDSEVCRMRMLREPRCSSV